MDYVNFGYTGLEVSRIGPGCTPCGRPAAVPLRPGCQAWPLAEPESDRFLSQAHLWNARFTMRSGADPFRNPMVAPTRVADMKTVNC